MISFNKLSAAFPATLLAVGLLASRPAHAQFFNNATGLTSPARTLTFNEVSVPDAQQLTTQFSTQGVTFSGLLYYDSTDFTNVLGSTGFSGAYTDTYNRNTATFTAGPYDIIFNTPVSAAAFAAVDLNNSYTFTALLGSTTVDSATLIVPTSPGAGFVGFRNETFDRIHITTLSSSGLALDTIQFTPAAVPEPGSIALLTGMTLAGAAFLRRRKQASKTV